MNKYRILILSIVVVLLIVVCGFIFYPSESHKSNIVFMENVEVFENFEMKKDYDLMIEKQMGHDKQTLDSLGFLIESLVKNSGNDTLKVYELKKEYYINQQMFEKKFRELSQKYTSEVYARLNEYIKEYGEEKKYDLVLGSNGEGNVMYVSDNKNITKELIDYINNKYKN